MADGRRTRWVAHDVYFLDDDLGATMFDRFGGVGIALWHGFIAACKKNHNEGETSFASDAEALTVFGLPGMPLVDSDGVPFELADWLQLLSDHKVIRRTSRGRRLIVRLSRKTWNDLHCRTHAQAERQRMTPALRAQVFERDEHCCVRCGAQDDLQADHIMPVSLGGLTEMDNLQTLCGPCNRIKGARHPDLWFEGVTA